MRSSGRIPIPGLPPSAAQVQHHQQQCQVQQQQQQHGGGPMPHTAAATAGSSGSSGTRPSQHQDFYHAKGGSQGQPMDWFDGTGHWHEAYEGDAGAQQVRGLQLCMMGGAAVGGAGLVRRQLGSMWHPTSPGV